MALLGAGCAPVLMAAMFIFAHSYPPARLAVMTSWLIAFGSAGNVAGTSPLAAAAEAFGWRHVMFAVAAVSVLTSVALMALVRDPEIARDPHASVGFYGFVEAMRLRKLWPLIPLVGMNYAPSVGILGLWAGPYLTDVYGANSLLIGHVTLFMAIAVVTGSLVYGPLDTIFGTRKWVAIAGNSGSVLVIAFLALFPHSGIARVTVALVLIGLFGASFALIMAHARAFLPRHLMGRGITLLNFFSMGTVGIMQFLTGAVATTASVPGKPAMAYSALFGFYALMLGIAVVIYLFSQDARPEGMEPRRLRSRWH
jgi:nitrate/nitrite transporter NarK